MKITYKEKELEVQPNETIKEALKEEISKSQGQIIGAKFNNTYQRLDYKLQEPGKLELVEVASKGGMKIYRRTLIFIMAKAFNKIYPAAKIRINYQLTNSMYCTIDNMEVTEEILSNVADEMKRIIDSNLPII